MSKTIAITGATGFAGRHTVAELLRRGHRLKALVRNPQAAGLPEDIEIVSGDLHTPEALARMLQGADAVVHLAGAISAVRTQDYFRVNENGSIAVAEAASRAGTARFVHVSSLSAREPLLSPYGASKRAGEEAITAMSSRLNTIILRPPAVYGPGDRATLPLLKELTKARAVIPGRADARFSLIQVGDLARLVADAVTGNVNGVHEISDETSGGYSWADLIAIGERERRAPIRPLFLPRAVVTGVAIAAEAWTGITGRPGMVSRGKVAELYHRDWVSGASGLKLPRPILFAQGFPETMAWYVLAGWLPHGPRADRTGDSDRDPE